MLYFIVGFVCFLAGGAFEGLVTGPYRQRRWERRLAEAESKFSTSPLFPE